MYISEFLIKSFMAKESRMLEHISNSPTHPHVARIFLSICTMFFDTSYSTQPELKLRVFSIVEREFGGKNEWHFKIICLNCQSAEITGIRLDINFDLSKRREKNMPGYRRYLELIYWRIFGVAPSLHSKFSAENSSWRNFTIKRRKWKAKLERCFAIANWNWTSLAVHAEEKKAECMKRGIKLSYFLRWCFMPCVRTTACLHV